MSDEDDVPVARGARLPPVEPGRGDMAPERQPIDIVRGMFNRASSPEQ